MRPHGELAVGGGRHARLLFENTGEIGNVVEVERIGNLTESHVVFLYEPHSFVDFKFRYIIDYRFVIILFEHAADVRNAVIQIIGDFP